MMKTILITVLTLSAIDPTLLRDAADEIHQQANIIESIADDQDVLDSDLNNVLQQMQQILNSLTGQTPPPLPSEDGESLPPNTEDDETSSGETTSPDESPSPAESEGESVANACEIELFYPWGEGQIHQSNFSFQTNCAPAKIIITGVTAFDGNPLTNVGVFSVEQNKWVLTGLNADSSGIVSFTLSISGNFIFGR